jgi:hypothetical protein
MQGRRAIPGGDDRGDRPIVVVAADRRRQLGLGPASRWRAPAAPYALAHLRGWAGSAENRPRRRVPVDGHGLTGRLLWQTPSAGLMPPAI